MQHFKKTMLSTLFMLIATTVLAQENAEVFIGLGHKAGINSVFISKDKKYAVTAGEDGFKVWNYENATLIKTIPASAIEGYKIVHGSGKKHLALAHNNKYIVILFKTATALQDNIGIIDIASGELVGSGIPHNSRNPIVDFISPDGMLVAATTGGRVSIYEIATGRRIQTANIAGTFHKLAYSADGKNVFVSTKKEYELSNIYKLDIGSGSIKPVYQDKLKRAEALAFSGDGTKALTVRNRRRAELWDLATGRTLNETRIKETYLSNYKNEDAYDATLSDDGSIAVIEFRGSEKGFASGFEYPVWNTLTGELESVVAYKDRGNREVSISPDNRYVAFDPDGATNNWIGIYDLLDGELTSIEFDNIVGDFVFCGDEGTVLAAYSATVERRNIETGETISIYGEQMWPNGSLHATPNGRYALSGSNLWNVRTGKLVQAFDQLKPREKYLKSGNMKVPNPTTILAMSPDGKSVIVPGAKIQVSAGGGVTFDYYYSFREFDLLTGAFIKTYEVPSDIVRGNELHSFTYTPDGRYLIAATRAGYTRHSGDINPFIQIWDTESALPVHRINIEGRSVDGFDVSLDGTSLLAATNFQRQVGVGTLDVHWEVSNKLSVFSITTGQKSRTIAQNDTLHGNFWDPRYFPDGSKLVADATVWDAGTGAVIKKFDFDFTGQGERIVISPDGSKFIRIGWKSEYINEIMDFKTGKTISTLKNAVPSAPTLFSRDGSKIFAFGGNGELMVFDAETGKELVSSYVFDDGEWITITPEGYYEASPGGGEHLNVRIGMEVFPIDNFFETYYRPDIVQAALGGRDVERLASSDIRTSTELPPSVRFTSPSGNTISQGQQLTLSAEITDQGGGIDEVRLFHNGKLVAGGTRGLKLASGGNTITREFDVTLLPGENRFELIALSTGQRIESNPAKLTINYQGTVATSDLYVLAVGLNEYKNNSLNLNYGRPDAEAFVNAVKQQSAGIFKSVNVTALHDGKATRASVKSAFDEIIARAQPQDAFLFFYAGHGVMSEPEGQEQGDFYMALHEATQLYGNNAGLKVHGISASEMTGLTRRIAARKQMIMLDACQSGGAVETFAMRGAAEQKAIIQLARSAGLVVLASTGTEQYATEFQALGHGVFTYALLNGLNGKADGGSRDGKITVKELEAFINDRVPALTTKHRGQAQYPNSYARGQDFPLVVVQK